MAWTAWNRFVGGRLCVLVASSLPVVMSSSCLICGDPFYYPDDWDGDGYNGGLGDHEDCDDEDDSIHPGAREECDGIDNDCDGEIDEDFDLDGDGYTTCGNDEQFGTEDDDCDDHDPNAHPHGHEVCDGADNDCDGVLFEGEEDADGDGYLACGDDCDDTNSGTYPDSDDVIYYDGEDQDCDGEDETDVDRDGFAWEGVGGEDCDDYDADVHPGAAELECDGVDSDCDGVDGGEDCGVELLDAADARFLGEARLDDAGRALAIVGDVDGDGYGDLVVGAPYNDEAAPNGGKAYLLLGPHAGPRALALADATFLGDEEHGELGTAVAAIDDQDGDGLSDILVGTPGRSYNQLGHVLVFTAPFEVAMTVEDAFAVLAGAVEMDDAGAAVAPAGDLDGDGDIEILVGAPESSELGDGVGLVYLVHGPVTGDQELSLSFARMFGESENDRAGEVVAGIGDVDGDGLDDFGIGVPSAHAGATQPGRVYLFFDLAQGDHCLDTAAATLEGETDGDGAGMALAAAGDLDGDGFGDMIVGAPWRESVAGNRGAAYVLYGPVHGSSPLSSADALIEAGTSSEMAGYSVLGPGDLDGDGFRDLVVGAPWYDSSRGRTFVFRGPISGEVTTADANLSYAGVASHDGSGRPLAAGDVDGDGAIELFIGAPYADAVGSSSGECYLVSGSH